MSSKAACRKWAENRQQTGRTQAADKLFQKSRRRRHSRGSRRAYASLIDAAEATAAEAQAPRDGQKSADGGTQSESTAKQPINKAQTVHISINASISSHVTCFDLMAIANAMFIN